MWETLVGKIPWRKKWPPTPAFFPGKSHGRRCLAVYSPGVAKSRTGLNNFTFTFFPFLCAQYFHLFTYLKIKIAYPYGYTTHIKMISFPRPHKRGKGKYAIKDEEMACSRNGGQHWKHLHHHSEGAGINAIFSKNMRWYIAQ